MFWMLIPLVVHVSEWKVALSQASVPAGMVTIDVVNDGSIPHQLEVEGRGIEKATRLIQPGEHATLTLNLAPGSYEVYCPVGNGSHKKLGMLTRLVVGTGKRGTGTSNQERERQRVKHIHVVGGGPVVQILPGPFPFADSAAATMKQFGEEQALLAKQTRNGPYSNNVARISGRFAFDAWDRGALRDSVSGVAEFTTSDGARWQLLLDKVQQKDVPHHPRFGGVIMGLYYHGNTGVHTPLVPTINSAVALWAWGRLTRNGARVTDSAAVHVMLLSHTRRADNYALACWDCSKNRVDELQLQITPGPGKPALEAPGGVLFVNWERSAAIKS